VIFITTTLKIVKVIYGYSSFALLFFSIRTIVRVVMYKTMNCSNEKYEMMMIFVMLFAPAADDDLSGLDQI